MDVPAILKYSDAYPPWDWDDINDMIEEAGTFSKHPLWLEMTENYDRSMAAKKHQFKTNKLSNTMSKEKYKRLPAEIHKAQNYLHDITNKWAQICGYITGVINDYEERKFFLAEDRLASIEEEE